MKACHLCLMLLLLPAASWAQKQQYVNDEITVSLRDGPRNDATFLGLLKSGDAVTVLENLGEQSFAKVRTADGRVGWVTARFLTDHPAATSLLADARSALDQARARIEELERELQAARSSAPPAPAAAAPAVAVPALPDDELKRQNAVLRTQIADLQRRLQLAESTAAGDDDRRNLMLTGGLLALAGLLLGMLLQGLAGRRRRHWSDF
ncbi:TIGR04211 family SH3 domain-containing protein [Fontimonas sp. SYSU GA230001]|uniref:TIGR04211 family SH3 domain-containing protein n=1 Tax=Fontimonas sp. SYSU GA230001 TaxID=3142450 RepID=UPI0032B46448